VPLPGQPVARGHLRLASAPALHRKDRRLLLFVRAAMAAIMLGWLTVAAWFATAVALAPLLWRRAPSGRRVRPPRRDARVIPLEPRRSARQAMPR
jgi:hypothetical protein